MSEARARGRQAGAAGKPHDRQPLDDWLGDVSDEDWGEDAAHPAAQRGATPARRERHGSEDRAEQDDLVENPAQAPTGATTETRRATVERRRATAALVALLLIGLGAGAAVLLVRDGEEDPVTTVPGSSTVSTPAPTETDPLPTTTPATEAENDPAFTLPEGTKLQRGESVGESDLAVSTDSELIAQLQRALVTAGFEPGTPDGTFGESTEAAVIAFQQANGLTPDGIVGPETADALSTAVADG